LKYKIELINIDKNDMAVAVEAKLVSLKTFIVNELNNFNDSLIDFGFETVSSKTKYSIISTFTKRKLFLRNYYLN
jgi:hypothetical protein